MGAIDPAVASAAVHRLLAGPREHGRVSRVASLFQISRRSLYRLEDQFLKTFGRGPGRPRRTPQQDENQQLQNRVHELQIQNQQLQAELDHERHATRVCAERVKFFLMASGLAARTIARLMRECFGIKANRTDILRQIEHYARRATEIMKTYFWTMAQDVDVDEIFIENRPLYLAADPQSMAILKASKEPQRTADSWSEFLNDLPHLKRTTSDRGAAILAAVAQRDGHVHQSDVFHPKRLIQGELGKVEKRCHKLMAQEYKAKDALDKAKARGQDCRGPAARYRHAYRKAQEALTLLDELDQAVDLAFQALRLTTCDGKLNTVARARESLEVARFWIHEHLPTGWSKPKSALQDYALLTFLEEFQLALQPISVQTETPEDREQVLAILCTFWEDQAKRRRRGQAVRVPHEVQQELSARCSNLPQVQQQLFAVLDKIHRASSAIECINSRVGFYRYTKRRFSTDYANLIAVYHNLTPFEEGKRANKSPAQILGVGLPTHDLYELFRVG